jgi:hypothetical protein
MAMAGNDRGTSACSRPGVAICLDLQWLATMLAVNCIRFVPVQATFRASILDLRWLENGSGQLQEKRHAYDHDEN